MSLANLAEMSPKGQEMLEDLPAYMQEDRTVQMLMDTAGRELQRVEDFLNELRRQLVPQNADDTFGLLSFWESYLGLPVKPDGVTVPQRQMRVLAWLRRRFLGRGEAWVQIITDALGSASWTYTENDPGPYQVTIRTQTGTSDYVKGRVEQLVRLVSPAHIRVIIEWGDGFHVGSDVGDPL